MKEEIDFQFQCNRCRLIQTHSVYSYNAFQKQTESLRASLFEKHKEISCLTEELNQLQSEIDLYRNHKHPEQERIERQRSLYSKFLKAERRHLMQIRKLQNAQSSRWKDFLCQARKKEDPELDEE